jgi:hypothetical protein
VTELVGVGRELKKTIGWQYTTSKVRKQDGEGTFAGTHGNDRVAPIRVIREAAIELARSTQSRRSLPSIAMPARAPNETLAPCSREIGKRPFELAWRFATGCTGLSAAGSILSAADGSSGLFQADGSQPAGPD